MEVKGSEKIYYFSNRGDLISISQFNQIFTAYLLSKPKIIKDNNKYKIVFQFFTKQA